MKRHRIDRWLTSTKSFASILMTPLEIMAVTGTVSFMVWADSLARGGGNPLFIPSFAASLVVIFAERTISVARSWNVAVGQFVGALAGVITVRVLTSPSWAAALLGVLVALFLMRLTSSIHPPGVATTLFVVLTPANRDPWFLLFPILSGAILIVAIAWTVRIIERRLRLLISRTS